MKISGFDTETIDGLAFMLASQEGVVRVNSLADCVRALFAPHTSVGFFYNLDYDARAILKYLDIKSCQVLYIKTKVSIEDAELGRVTFEYLPRKYLGITLARKLKKCPIRKVELFDLWQYYGMKLDAAARKYLTGEVKDDMPLEIVKNLGAYLDKPEVMAQVSAYCWQDAKLCHALAEYLINALNECHIDVERFYSTGYLAKRVLAQHHTCVSLPYNVEQFAREAFHGGRIEVIQRGHFDTLHIYDINSAYPSTIQDLQDTCECSYAFSNVPQAERYFLDATLTLRDGLDFYPLAVKRNNRTIFPRLVNHRVTITDLEHKCLVRHGLIQSIEIHRALNITPITESKPFAFVPELYAEREKGAAQSLIFKLILNSMYGVFCERTKDYRLLSAGEEYQRYKADCNAIALHRVLGMYRACQDYWACDCMACTQARSAIRTLKIQASPTRGEIETLDGIYVRRNRAGRFNNAIYASYITAATRVKVFDFAMRNLGHVVAFATDAVMLDAPTECVINPVKTLGAFSAKESGHNAVMLGSGVYEYDTESSGRVTHFRGFSTNINIRQALLSCFGDTIRLPLERVVGMAAIVAAGVKSLESLNQFIDVEKALQLNFDTKRIWQSQFVTGLDALYSVSTSKPLTVTGAKSDVFAKLETVRGTKHE